MSTPAPERCVLRDLLQRHRRERPEQVFAWFEDGETWTYAETAARAERLGAALQGLGVGQGDTVLVWLPNGKPALEAYFACGVIGAVYVPINTAYRGALLAHVIENSGARIGIVQDALMARLADVATADLHTIVGSAHRRRCPMTSHCWTINRLSQMPARRPRPSIQSNPGTHSRLSIPRARPGRRKACCRPTCTTTPA